MSFMAVKKYKEKKRTKNRSGLWFIQILKVVRLKKLKEDANFFDRYVKLGTICQ